MFNQSTIQGFLAARKPYPNALWQSWLGLSTGGWNGVLRAKCWEEVVALLTLPPTVCLLLVSIIQKVDRLTPTGIVAFSLLGLLSVMVWYVLLVSLSAGYLHPEQMKEFSDRVQADPRLDVAAGWLAGDDLPRTRDLWRLRCAAWALSIHDRRTTAPGVVLSTIASLRNTPAPLPTDLTAAEQSQVTSGLASLCRPAPIATGWLYRLSSPFLRALSLLLPWGAMGASTRATRLTQAISIGVQLAFAIWIIPLLVSGNSRSAVMGGVGAVLVLNAALLTLPSRLRIAPPASLWIAAQKQLAQCPLAAWVLSQRSPDPDRISARDIVQSFRAAGLLRHYHARRQSEWLVQAYRQQLDSLPAIGASRAQAHAQALEEDTVSCETAQAPRRL